MKKILLSIITITSLGLSAQTIDDLSLFNTQQLRGTPRYVGTGGAFMALGNDLSALHINPAAGAVFRNTTLGVSLGFNTNAVTPAFAGQNTTSQNDFSLNLDNVGYNYRFRYGRSDWSEFNFAISYNRLADFDQTFDITGTNDIQTNQTLGQYWLAGANGVNNNDLLNQGLIEEAAAVDAFVLLLDSNNLVADYGYYLPASGTTNLRYLREQRGSLNEFALNFGGSYKSEFYYGFSLGFPTLSYIANDLIEESGLVDSAAPYDVTSYSLARENQISANGINIKAGIIYRPAKWLRVGASYQSPSWFLVRQVYNLDVASVTATDGAFLSPEYTTGEYSYRVQTPQILRGGLAILLGQSGFLSFDYERADASQTRVFVGSNSVGFTSDDALAATNQYQPLAQATNTFKFGGEYRIGHLFLRAGFQQRQSQFTNEQDYISDSYTNSFGLGYKNEDWGISIAYARTLWEQAHVAHAFTNDLVFTDVIQSNVVAGINFRF